MKNMHLSLTAWFFLVSTTLLGQKQFKVVSKDTDSWRQVYYLVDKDNNIIRQLDTAKYLVSINTEVYGHFAIFGIKGVTGWAAIDENENILFKVYNTSTGEPSPDVIVEDRIRIVDENNLVGFANSKGTVVIKPQFEIASSFNKGRAIIGKQCRNIPWDNHTKETDCQHYSIVCTKHGYIDATGEVIKLGDFTFEQIKKEINWASPDE